MIKRTYATFGPLLALGVLFTSTIATAQETVQQNTNLEPCMTSTGIPGTLFLGLLSTIDVPEGFSSAKLTPADRNVYVNNTVSNNNMRLYGDVLFGKQLLVQIEENAAIDGATKIEFLDDLGEVLQTCSVSFVSFDPVVHDLSKISIGFCSFNEETGIRALGVGEKQLLDFPEKVADHLSWPTTVLTSVVELGAQQVTFTGISEGYAMYAWLGDDVGNGMLRGLCPFFVSDQRS